MTGFDYGLLVILGVSSFLGARRGLIKELLSLVSFALAGLAAVWWGGALSSARWLQWVDNAYLRMGIAYVVLFVLALVVLGLINMGLGSMLKGAGLAGADRGLGLMYGLVRGLLVSLLIVIVLGYTPVIEEPAWKNGMFTGSAVDAVRQIKLRLPESVAQWLPY